MLLTILRRLAGLTCMAGGLSWFSFALLEASGTGAEWRPTADSPAFALIVIFIRPTGRPSVTLLAFWGLAWVLLGYAIWSAARTSEAAARAAMIS